MFHQQGRHIVTGGCLLNTGVELAPGGAAAVENGFPAGLGNPLLDGSGVYAVSTKVVKAVLDAIVAEPVAGLLDSVAVFNPVDGNQCINLLVYSGCEA